MSFLRTDILPQFLYCNFRYFDPKEKHITRFSKENVLLLIFDGVLRFSEDNIPVELHPGEYYIQKSGLFQSGPLPSDEPKYFYVHFHGEWSDTDGIAKRGVFDRELISEMEKLLLLSNSDASHLNKSAVFFSILSALQKTSSLSVAQKLTDSVKQLLTDNLKSGISADEMSARLNFSKNYIIRIFRQETGVTPHSYLLMLRIRKAEQLLCYSDLSVEKIAEECGFSNYSGFYRAFTEKNRISPREYSVALKNRNSIDNRQNL